MFYVSLFGGDCGIVGRGLSQEYVGRPATTVATLSSVEETRPAGEWTRDLQQVWCAV